MADEAFKKVQFDNLIEVNSLSAETISLFKSLHIQSGIELKRQDLNILDILRSYCWSMKTHFRTNMVLKLCMQNILLNTP